MTAFIFITQGIDVGYDEDGFFAYGETTNHKFNERDWVGHGLPRFQGKPIFWRIGSGRKDMWVEYIAITGQRATAKPTDLTKEWFQRYDAPVGLLLKLDPYPIRLTYSLHTDPALASLIMGAVAAERELVFWCEDFMFVDETKPAPVPSVSGFMERQEPLFLFKTLSIKFK